VSEVTKTSYFYRLSGSMCIQVMPMESGLCLSPTMESGLCLSPTMESGLCLSPTMDAEGIHSGSLNASTIVSLYV